MAPEDDVFNEVRPNRRGFVKGVVGTTAFAAPFVASFDLGSLSAKAAVVNPNQTSPPPVT
jgi:hypothetical protein